MNGLEGDTKWNREIGAYRTQIRVHKDVDAEWFHDPGEPFTWNTGPHAADRRARIKPFPLARTAEEPATQGDHVLFTHPYTWLRDIDPHCREACVLGAAAEGRDRYRYGIKLGPRHPLDIVCSLLIRTYDPRSVRITFNGIEIQGFMDGSSIF